MLPCKEKKNVLNEFLDNHKPNGKSYSMKSRQEFIKTFSMITEWFDTDNFIELTLNKYNDIIKKILDKYTNENTRRNHWGRVNTFCKYHGIAYEETDAAVGGKEVNLFNIVKIRSDVEKISDLKAKSFLKLLTNTSQKSVRRDWATVMISSRIEKDDVCKSVYHPDTGIFEFFELNKTGRSMTFQIEDDIRETLTMYIKSTVGKYLYSYNATDETDDTARIASYAQYLARITTKYLGKSITSTDFRKNMVIYNRNDIMESDLSPAEKLEKLVESARGKDHCVEVEAKYYTEKTDTSVKNVGVQTDKVNLDKDILIALINQGKSNDEINQFFNLFQMSLLI